MPIQTKCPRCKEEPLFRMVKDGGNFRLVCDQCEHSRGPFSEKSMWPWPLNYVFS